jgi:hypothetical protein
VVVGAGCVCICDDDVVAWTLQRFAWVLGVEAETHAVS